MRVVSGVPSGVRPHWARYSSSTGWNAIFLENPPLCMMLSLCGMPHLPDRRVIHDRRDTASVYEGVAAAEVCDTLPFNTVPGSRPIETSEEVIGAVACRERVR